MKLGITFQVGGKQVTKEFEKGICIYKDDEGVLYLTTTYSNDIYCIIKNGKVIDAAEMEVKTVTE